jgi:WD40 repeat protein
MKDLDGYRRRAALRTQLGAGYSVSRTTAAADSHDAGFGSVERLFCNRDLFDLAREPPKRVEKYGPTALGKDCRLVENGRRLAAGFYGAIQIWGVPNRKLIRTLDGFERGVTRLAFSPTGDTLAAGTSDGQVWIWATATGRRTQVIDTGTRGVRSLAFSAEGKLLVTATNKAPVVVSEVTPEPANDPDT